VRPARAGDADYIRSLGKKVFEQYGPYESLLVQWLELGITVTLLALMEKHAVGFAMLRRLGHGWSLPGLSELLAIAVEPAKKKKYSPKGQDAIIMYKDISWGD